MVRAATIFCNNLLLVRMKCVRPAKQLSWPTIFVYSFSFFLLHIVTKIPEGVVIEFQKNLIFRDPTHYAGFRRKRRHHILCIIFCAVHSIHCFLCFLFNKLYYIIMYLLRTLKSALQVVFSLHKGGKSSHTLLTKYEVNNFVKA